MTDRLAVADEVREALDARRPVVALESTIVAHGLPCVDPMRTGVGPIVDRLAVNRLIG